VDWMLAFLAAYLIGSIPFGLLLAGAAGKGDIRQIGSGNIGATNVLRTGSKWLAAATLLLDLAKGFFAVWLAVKVIDRPDLFPGDIAAVAGVAAVLGHCFPIWLRFRGGKGVATLMGVALAFDLSLGAVFALVWLGMLVLTRTSSLSGMSAAVAAPIAAHLSGIGPKNMFFALVALALLVLWNHRANISRLVAGTEPKVGSKK
jgi:glycerol-3-phosphate acyltransferase PlsY